MRTLLSVLLTSLLISCFFPDFSTTSEPHSTYSVRLDTIQCQEALYAACQTKALPDTLIAIVNALQYMDSTELDSLAAYRLLEDLEVWMPIEIPSAKTYCRIPQRSVSVIEDSSYYELGVTHITHNEWIVDLNGDTLQGYFRSIVDGSDGGGSWESTWWRCQGTDGLQFQGSPQLYISVRKGFWEVTRYYRPPWPIDIVYYNGNKSITMATSKLQDRWMRCEATTFHSCNDSAFWQSVNADYVRIAARHWSPVHVTEDSSTFRQMIEQWNSFWAHQWFCPLPERFRVVDVDSEFDIFTRYYLNDKSDTLAKYISGMEYSYSFYSISLRCDLTSDSWILYSKDSILIKTPYVKILIQGDSVKGYLPEAAEDTIVENTPYFQFASD